MFTKTFSEMSPYNKLNIKPALFFFAVSPDLEDHLVWRPFVADSLNIKNSSLISFMSIFIANGAENNPLSSQQVRQMPKA